MDRLSVSQEQSNTETCETLFKAQGPQAFYVAKPFSWLSDDAQRTPGADVISVTCDISQGIAIILDMVQDATGMVDCGETPPLNRCQCGDLLRFATAAARMLARMASDTCDEINISADEANA